MTLYELHRYARGAAQRDWETTSFLAALIYNCNRSRKDKAKTPDDFNPFKVKTATKKPIDQLARDFGARIDLKQ